MSNNKLEIIELLKRARNLCTLEQYRIEQEIQESNKIKEEIIQLMARGDATLEEVKVLEEKVKQLAYDETMYELIGENVNGSIKKLTIEQGIDAMLIASVLSSMLYAHAGQPSDCGFSEDDWIAVATNKMELMKRDISNGNKS